MIVPITSSPNSENNNNNSNNNNNTNNTPNFEGLGSFNIPSLCYEPTSVLDLRRSPSPTTVASGKPAKGNSVNTLNPDPAARQPNDALAEWDEHLHSLDWDTIMRDLGLHDDSAPPFKPNITAPATAGHHHAIDGPQFPAFSDALAAHPPPFDHDNPNYDVPFSDFNNGVNGIGFDFIEDLIRVADCVDSDDPRLAQAMLEKLNQRVRSGSGPVKPVGRPLQRAALCFKDALQSLIVSGPNRTNRTNRLSSWSEIVQSIKAYKAFSVISPISMFSHFTTNQALLEALHGSSILHVIDFDIGLGGQYASLMRELAERHNSFTDSPILRVTAIVPEEYAVESRLVRENLTQFARDLKIRFHVDFVLFKTFEAMSFKSIRLADGEKIAVILSAAAFRRLPDGIFADMRRIWPVVVVFVDGEGLGETSATTSFRKSIVTGLEFYSVVMESLDAAMAGADVAGRIEAQVLKPRVFAAVEAAMLGAKTASFRESLHVAGMRPVELSQFADFQAECLLSHVHFRGFHVARRQAELVLCWHERPVVATSVWKC